MHSSKKSSIFAADMKKIILFALVSAVVLTSCGPSAAEKRRAEKHVSDSIALVEQQKSLVYYQSQLDEIMPKADSLLPLFDYTKDSLYQDYGFYGLKAQQVERNTNRNYVQALVRDDGKPLVRAYYFGNKEINFQRVSLAVGDIEIKLSGSVHSFEAGGWHQIMTLEDSVAMEALRFLDAHVKDKVRVAFGEETKNAVSFNMTDADKKALAQAYHLSVVMSDVYILEHRVKHTSLEVEKYQRRLSNERE